MGSEAAGRLGAEARREDMRGESEGICIANIGRGLGELLDFVFFNSLPK